MLEAEAPCGTACGGSQLCCQALRLDESIFVTSKPEQYPPLGLPEGWSETRMPKRGQQRLGRQQRPCHGFLQTHFTSACLYESHPQGNPTQDHVLWPVAGSLLSMLPLSEGRVVRPLQATQEEPRSGKKSNWSSHRTMDAAQACL